MSDVLEIEQRSEEWFEARLGKATASRFKDILAVTKSGTKSAARRNYAAQLVIERLTGQRAERFTSPAMEWGTETEDLARLAYTLSTKNLVQEIGFVQAADLEAGASPDGFIGVDGCVEIKCRLTANHIETLKAGHMPAEHVPQVQGQMWITGRKWCDFVSFEPTLPENARLFIERIERDDEYIAGLEAQVKEFLSEVAADVAFLESYRRAA
jgi:putative phage-type endonuclease